MRMKFGVRKEDRGMRVLTLVKVYAVEVAGTAVFLVFIAVEAIRAIRHLIEMLK